MHQKQAGLPMRRTEQLSPRVEFFKDWASSEMNVDTNGLAARLTRLGVEDDRYSEPLPTLDATCRRRCCSGMKKVALLMRVYTEICTVYVPYMFRRQLWHRNAS